MIIVLITGEMLIGIISLGLQMYMSFCDGTLPYTDSTSNNNRSMTDNGDVVVDKKPRWWLM